jgi:hypothetical protein
MTSVQDIAPRDDVRFLNVKIKNDHGVVMKEIPVEYFRNRITLAGVKFRPTDEDIERYTEAELDNIEAATTMCTYVKSWDIEGELYDNEGNLIVPKGELVPLDPRVARFLPMLIILQVMNQVTEDALPNQRGSRNERRRSR